MKDYANAERLFDDLKKVGFGEPGAVAFYLGEIAEETKHYDEAIARYREVTDGDRAWLAKLRIAAIMGKQGHWPPRSSISPGSNLTGATRRSSSSKPRRSCCRMRATYKGAYAVLNEALADDPDSADLLYDAAMVAEKLDRLDEVESRLEARDRTQARQCPSLERTWLHAWSIARSAPSKA